MFFQTEHVNVVFKVNDILKMKFTGIMAQPTWPECPISTVTSTHISIDSPFNWNSMAPVSQLSPKFISQMICSKFWMRSFFQTMSQEVGTKRSYSRHRTSWEVNNFFPLGPFPCVPAEVAFVVKGKVREQESLRGLALHTSRWVEVLLLYIVVIVAFTGQITVFKVSVYIEVIIHALRLNICLFFRQVPF